MARKPKRNSKTKTKKVTSSKLPTREDILRYVNSAQGQVGKREIARAFGLKGAQRVALKTLLAEMTSEGLITGTRKSLRQPGHLPAVTIIEVTGHDDNGDLIAQPTVWDETDGTAGPVGLVLEPTNPRSSNQSVGIGDRVLAHIATPTSDPDTLAFNPDLVSEAYSFTAKPIRKLARERRRLLGIYRKNQRGGGTIEPIERKAMKSWAVRQGDEGEAKDGDLVYFDMDKQGRHRIPHAKISQALGNPDDDRQISLIAIHAHGLPDGFPNRVLAETEDLTPPKPDTRTDLTKLPLITIDPPDARDHDDAVHAEPDTDPKNTGGYIVTVAIADVAHYIKIGSHLDREALKRANSVYFPDRVVPMLPEKISNDLCSLREGENRPCLAVELVFDANGKKRRHKFHRAIMKSAAKLSYQEAQAAIDGNVSDKCAPLLETILKPLWQAYATVSAARNKRGPLELNIPERKIKLDDKGRVKDVVVPDRLDAHRLIEEFMIQANVAAAETLEEKTKRLIFRAHDKPSKEKLKSLRDFLETLDLKIPAADKLRPRDFNGILRQAEDMPVRDLVNEVVLRSQAQAEYTPDNYGHFGLNLSHYAHFTSPIRRYADLVVHRLLIMGLKLGDGGYTEDTLPNLGDISQSISEAERRAMVAERETVDRLIAAHLSDKLGSEFPARISGVTKSGLFIRLEETGADGFVPISTLGDDYYQHFEDDYALVGQKSGRTYRLGDTVRVRLEEAIPTAGALRFEMLSDGRKGQPLRTRAKSNTPRPRYNQRPRSKSAKFRRRKRARDNADR